MGIIWKRWKGDVIKFKSDTIIVVKNSTPVEWVNLTWDENMLTTINGNIVIKDNGGTLPTTTLLLPKESETSDGLSTKYLILRTVG